MELFLRHPWPGNIRELANTLEHAVVRSKGSIIEVDALPRAFVRTQPQLPSRSAAGELLARTLDVLARFEGNQSRAARALGINRTTLWRRLRKAGAGRDDR
jgi:two-component system response regulator HydG